jgi:photosystem II stability/assembly factor-like uncharacterized protein
MILFLMILRSGAPLAALRRSLQFPAEVARRLLLGRAMHPSFRSLPIAFLSLVVLLPARSEDNPGEPKGGPPHLKRLRFRNIGPSAGGRVCRVAGVPGDPLTCYAATAASGVWKSSDGGLHWKPVTDAMPTSTFGSIAISPSDPNVIYAGSGEANIRGNVEVGNGIYRSTDAGKTWQHVWKQEGQIGTMLVHPTNPDVAYAAVLGKAFGPSEERGVYRTTNGGKTWNRILYKNADSGASDVCFDPRNPRILFAGIWQVRRRPWEMTSGGPGSGLYVSRDSGDTWTQLVAPPPEGSPDFGRDPASGTKRCKGLPEGLWGKVTVAVAPSDSQRVYAMIEADKGGLFRSNDGGDTWENVNGHRAIRQRAWYFSTFTVDPRNADILWFPQVPLLKSIDGGRSLLRVKGPHHGDHHDIWIDPKNPQRVIDANDGGVDLSSNGGQTWHAPPLPLGQFYHISVDNRTPYRISGTMQDIGTAQGPSNSLLSGGIPLAAWYPVGGGETGFTASDPDDPNIVYAGEYGGYVTRWDYRTRQARDIGIYPFNPSGHGAEDLKYRFQWTAPLMVSPHDGKVVYHAANVLFRTRDAGLTWTPISKDLTRNDRSKQKWSGGPITGDNTGVEVYGTIFAVTESPKQRGVLWAGSDDGLVHVTRDDGKTWENVTAGLTKAGLPEWGTVVCIEPSPFDADAAYVVADAHKLDDRKPYLFATADGGKTWRSLTAKVPLDQGYLDVVREDPKKKGLLYAGSERGILTSSDAGASWEPLKLNFPSVRVTDLVVKDDDLVVGTNGRSIWILDDLTPLRLGKPTLTEEAQLLPPQPAHRYRYSSPLARGLSTSIGQNPPEGAILHYRLRAKPKGDVVLKVRDGAGKVIRTLTSKKEPEEPADEGAYDESSYKPVLLPTEEGLHRVVWDLRMEGADTIRGARVDSGEPRVGPLVNPGTYTVELLVGGKAQQEKLEVKLDPREVGRVEPADLEQQLRLTVNIRDEITLLVRTAEQLRSVRKQLQEREELLADEERGKELVKAAKALLPKLDEVEAKLHNPKAKVAYDILAQKGGAQLYSQLVWQYELLKEGDGPPTQGLREVHAEQAERLKAYAEAWQKLVKEDIVRLNALAKKLDLPGVVVPSGRPGKAGRPAARRRR